MERHCYPNPGRAVRTADFLYIRNYNPDKWPTGEGKWPSEDRDFSFNIDPSPTKRLMMARRADAAMKRLYRLAFGPRPREELYDLGKDAGQVHNVAGKPEYEEARRRLSALLARKLRDSGDPRVKGQGDRFNRYRSG